MFFLLLPDFYQKIKLSSLLIKYFQFKMVLIEHRGLFEKILDEIPWNASQSPTQAFLGSLWYIGYNEGQI